MREPVRILPLRSEALEPRRMLAGDLPVETVGLPAAADEGDAARVEVLLEVYREVIGREHEDFLARAEASGRDGVQLYNLQLALDGVISMYEATGDAEVLATAVAYSRAVMDSAQVIEDGWYEADGFLDWEVTRGGEPRARRQGFVLYDFQIGSALSRLARVLHEDQAGTAGASGQQFGGELASFVDRHIVYKWLDFRGQRRWLETQYDRRGYWDDKATHIVNICHQLDVVLGAQSHCLGIEQDLAQQFRDLLVLKPDGAFVWGIGDEHPAGHAHPAPDTAHENRVATMVLSLAADGKVFSWQDVIHLGQTFTQRIWNGRLDWDGTGGVQDSPWFHNYIDGFDAAYRGHEFAHGPEGMNGFVYDGWVKLGQYVPEAQQAAESLLQFVLDVGTSENAIAMRNGTRYGLIALSGHLARNIVFRSDVAATPLAAPAPASVPGDVNQDGQVTLSDFLVLSSHFGQSAGHEQGDLDGDGVVAFGDFLLLSQHFV